MKRVRPLIFNRGKVKSEMDAEVTRRQHHRRRPHHQTTQVIDAPAATFRP
jgi:hypothetical protein